MNLNTLLRAALGTLGLLLAPAGAFAGGSEFAVTVTNLTRDQNFTPILVASHRRGVQLFELGAPAGDALAALAEGGDVAPLTALWEADERVIAVANSGGLLEPGHSVTIRVSARGGANRISLASMMIPTNDGFLALNGASVARGGESVFLSPAYDAGSEPNDELCASIPGPDCGGEGGSPGAGGEGYVHIHGGIHGIGDLSPAQFDWRNPVARIEVRRHR